ncbi:MAG: hypothetical protein QM496_06970 [Verrucomicrobiota bacterium]
MELPYFDHIGVCCVLKIYAGEGGPFNPRVPEEVFPRVKDAIEGILDLH